MAKGSNRQNREARKPKSNVLKVKTLKVKVRKDKKRLAAKAHI